MMSKVRARLNGKLVTKNCLKNLSRKKLAAKYPMKHPETGKRMSRAEIIKQARSKRKDGQQLNLREMKLLYHQDVAHLKQNQKRRCLRAETTTAILHHEKCLQHHEQNCKAMKESLKREEVLKKEIAELKLRCEKQELALEVILRKLPRDVEIWQEFRKTEEGKHAPPEGLDAVIEYMNKKRTAAACAAKKTTELDRLKSDRDQIRKW